MTEKTFLAQTIFETLKKELSEQVYKINALLPSEKDLSQRFKVSRVTVRNALNRLNEENLVYSQPGRGWIVGVSKKTVKEKTDKVETKEVLLICPPTYLSGLFFQGLSEELRSLDLRSRLLITEHFSDYEKLFNIHSEELKSDALVFFNSVEVDSTSQSYLKNKGKPIVFCGISENIQFDTISFNYEMAIESLLLQAKKDNVQGVIYLYNSLLSFGSKSFALRRKTFENLSGKIFHQDVVLLPNFSTDEDWSTETNEQVDRLIKNQPSQNILLFSDSIEIVNRCLPALNEKHPKLKDKLKLGTSQFPFQYSSLKRETGLTIDFHYRVFEDWRQMGMAAAQTIFHRLKNSNLMPNHTQLSCRLSMDNFEA